MTVSARENAALVRRFLTDVLAGSDLDAVDGFLTDDVDDRHPVFQEVPGQGSVTGLGWRALSGADIDVTVDDVVATADRVAVRGTVRGTHRESLLDLAPTGQSFEIAHAWFCRIEDDQISAIWSLPDGLGLLADLGVVSRGATTVSPNRDPDHP